MEQVTKTPEQQQLSDAPEPVVQSPPEDRISRAVRLELERVRFEKEAKRRYRRARARSPNRAPRRNGRTDGLQPAVTHAAPVPVIEYVSPISAVHATHPVNEYAAPALLICRRVALWTALMNVVCQFCECFFNNANETTITARRAAPRSAIKVTCNHVNMFLYHISTDCKKQLLSDTAFLGIMVVDVQRHHGEKGLAVAR